MAVPPNGVENKEKEKIKKTELGLGERMCGHVKGEGTFFWLLLLREWVFGAGGLFCAHKIRECSPSKKRKCRKYGGEIRMQMLKNKGNGGYKMVVKGLNF